MYCCEYFLCFICFILSSKTLCQGACGLCHASRGHNKWSAAAPGSATVTNGEGIMVTLITNKMWDIWIGWSKSVPTKFQLLSCQSERKKNWWKNHSPLPLKKDLFQNHLFLNTIFKTMSKAKIERKDIYTVFRILLQDKI